MSDLDEQEAGERDLGGRMRWWWRSHVHCQYLAVVARSGVRFRSSRLLAKVGGCRHW